MQIIACAVVFVGLRSLDAHISLLQFAFACGGIAAALGFLSRLEKWWLPIQVLFIPGLVLMLIVNLPPIIYLMVFLVLLAVYWSTFHTQVPLYLSSRQVWLALEKLLPADQAFTFMDIGSGVGGVLTHLAKARPHGRYYGVELAPLPFLISWVWLRLRGLDRCTVQWGSFWRVDLARYDVVFAYLSPIPMEHLWRKVQDEMRPGTLFVSNTFIVPEYPPAITMQVRDMHNSTLYIWRM